MKKTLLFAMLCCFALISAVAQPDPCTDFNGGPYNTPDFSVAGCDGQTVSAPFAAWVNEVYVSELFAGGEYTFSIAGCDDSSWGGEVLINVLQGGTLNADPDGYQGPGTGSINGATVITVGTGCEVTFTATVSGTYYFILTAEGACGGENTQVDNGSPPAIETLANVPCGECGDGVCGAGEGYCECAEDCDCQSLISPVFIYWDATANGGAGGFIGDDAQNENIIFCPLELEERIGIAGEEGSLYVGLGFFGADCFEGAILLAEPEQGVLLDFNLSSVSEITEATVYFLQINQSDIDASGGTTDIVLTNPDDPGCTTTYAIDWAGLGQPTGLVDALCPPLNSECGANGCEPGENYCNCDTDCSCADLLDPAFVYFDEAQGGWIGTATQVPEALTCDYDLGVSDPGFVYVGVSFFGNNCLNDAVFNATTSHGELVQFDANGASTVITELAEQSIAFLRIDQAEITASGGFTTIFYANPDDANCTVNLSIDWSQFGAPADNLVESLCPQGECGDGACEGAENYCNCTDCACGDALSVGFVVVDDQGNASLTETEDVAAVACDDADVTIMYVNVAFVASASATCLVGATLEASASQGTLVEVDTDGNLNEVSEMIEANAAYYLQVSQAQIDASGGTTTITLTDPNAPTGSSCTVNLAINWADFGLPVGSIVFSSCDPDNVPTVAPTGFGIQNIMPVPATDQVQVLFSTIKATTVKATIFDVMGRTIDRQDLASTGGNNTLNLNVSNYPAGIYYIVLNDGTHSVMGKIVKQ